MSNIVLEGLLRKMHEVSGGENPGLSYLAPVPKRTTLTVLIIICRSTTGERFFI
jgi:hypothetical protein